MPFLVGIIWLQISSNRRAASVTITELKIKDSHNLGLVLLNLSNSHLSCNNAFAWMCSKWRHVCLWEPNFLLNEIGSTYWGPWFGTRFKRFWSIEPKALNHIARCLLHILRLHSYLVITKFEINLGKYHIPMKFSQETIYYGKWKLVLDN